MTEQELLNRVLVQISNSIDSETIEIAEQLSKIYQRIKSVQTTNVNDLQQFLKAAKE